MLLRYVAGLKAIEGGGGFEVIVPDLPEIATFGENFVDAVEMARDAVELVLEDLRADGEAAPQPRDQTVVWSELVGAGYNPHLIDVDVEETAERYNISMAPSLMARVDRAATAEGMSRSAFIASAVKQVITGARAGALLNLSGAAATGAAPQVSEQIHAYTIDKASAEKPKLKKIRFGRRKATSGKVTAGNAGKSALRPQRSNKD